MDSTKILNYIIDALGEFNGKYDKKFNLSKLLDHLNVPTTETSIIISVILNFQVKFETVFKKHGKVRFQQLYIVIERYILWEYSRRR